MKTGDPIIVRLARIGIYTADDKLKITGLCSLSKIETNVHDQEIIVMGNFFSITFK